MTNGPRDPSDLYGVKADLTASPPPSRVIGCRMSCGFVAPGASARRRRTGSPLRKCSVPRPRGARSAISSTWQRPTARHPGRRLGRIGRRWDGMLRPGCRVVALREVGEMARTRTSHPPDLPHDPIISETCPPGEGALPCSWDGPLDCQALAARARAGAMRLPRWPTRPRASRPVRASVLWLSLS
jgi:hypothetical protein